MKPLVIVTGPDRRFPFAWWATRLALQLVGLRAHRVTPSMCDIPHEARGVVIGGGTDIDPEHYGLSGDAGATYDPERDALEMAVVRDAFHSRVPILGICRGAQLINVVKGGNLHQDLRPLRKYTPNRNSVRAIKSVEVEDTSFLSRIFSTSPIAVNSLHNQAVDSVGKSLQAVAWDKDGFIQAVEGAGSQFVIGVQWHPEYLIYSSEQRRLFKAFAKAVKQSAYTVLPVTLSSVK